MIQQNPHDPENPQDPRYSQGSKQERSIPSTGEEPELSGEAAGASTGSGRPLQPRRRARPALNTGMLPGMALIAMYLLVLGMLNAFAAMRGAFGNSAAKYSILGVCTILVIGVYGMLRLTRWGWAIVTAGCLLMAAGYFYGFHRTHIPPYIINGLFALVFFLYLSRTEVRDRVH